MTERDIESEKKVLRQQCRIARKNILPAQRAHEQKLLNQKIEHFISNAQQKSVLVYAATVDECSCDQICEILWQTNTAVYFPKVTAARSLSWHQVSTSDQLVAGYQGIREPTTPPTTSATHIPAHCIILVPGLAFSKEGQRLGMGGGFYDSVLAQLDQDSVSIGLAWTCQIHQNIPMEKHDQKVDVVLGA